MSNLEHYFENLLFEGQDCKGNPNKNSLTHFEQKAVEICADYVIYTLFGNRENFLKWNRRSEAEDPYDSTDEFIDTLLDDIEKYRHAAFIIGEICVEESKQHITPEQALEKIRRNIYYTRHE